MSDPRWTARWGHHELAVDYGFDVGSLHIIDFYLYHCWHSLGLWPSVEPPHSRFSPANWPTS